MNISFLKSKKISVITLILVLIVQLFSLIVVSFEKEGFHIDETYTYILSNSYDANRISHDEKAMTSWNDGAYFNKFVVVDENETFSYDTVKSNNGLDAHPPLYYYAIHTVSSLAPGAFSKWIGLGLNCVFFIGIQIILYLLTLAITKKNYCGVAAVALNGGLAAVMDMVLFIRMYTLLTFLSMLFVYMNYLIYRCSQKKRLYIITAIVSFLGIYTHYYFAFLAFFVAAAQCLWLLKKRNYKMLVLYSLLMLVSVAIVFIIYPDAISQISGSDTNNIGKEVSKNIFNFAAFPSALFSMTVQIAGGFLSAFLNNILLSVFCIFITALISFLSRKKIQQKNQNNDIGKILLILSVVLVLIVVTITHISGKFTYVRYVYHIFPLFSLFAVLFALYIGTKIKLNLKVLCIGIICFGMIGTISFVKNDLSSYTFKEKHDKETKIISQCQDKPLVMISNGTTYHPTANFEILRNASQVYIYNLNNEVDIDKILYEKNIENGVVFMVLTDRYWSDGFDGNDVMEKITDESNILDDFEYYGDSEFSMIYIAK